MNCVRSGYDVVVRLVRRHGAYCVCEASIFSKRTGKKLGTATGEGATLSSAQKRARAEAMLQVPMSEEDSD